MVDKGILREFEIDETLIEEQVKEALGADSETELLGLIDKTVSSFEPGAILTGRIVNRVGDDVVVEVGLKSEGTISASEFDDPSEIQLGRTVDVLLEAIESDSGLVILSKRKADRIRGWERIINNYKEGDTITGRVSRRIKGGLLVDVGVPVFLPASQVDIRRPGDIAEYIGREIDSKILKIDEERRNIVVSRRKLLEETRAAAKSNLLGEIEVGQIRQGVVKNIADFGAFVDLGGLDGLLHITDMSWGRVSHPSELVKLDQKIEVKILSIDREREKIALGLKQKTESPWVSAEQRYLVNSVAKGVVVNITNYGAFVKLEEGVEGLVHISEMSWTKRISHPSELLSSNQDVEVVVLQVNPAKQEISLGLKQLTQNPWTQVSHKYPPGSIIEGRVRNLANYGAFIEIEEGIDGLLHVSDMSWTKKIGHPGELLKRSQMLKCIVLAVDENKQRVALGLKQMTEDPWVRAIPEKYIPGQIIQGKVTKLTNFGVFVELEPDLEGLLHVSELSDDKVEAPQDVVKVGDDLEVKILRVDIEDRKIGLSLKRAQWAAEETPDQAGRSPQRGGLDGAAGMGVGFIDSGMLQRRREEAQEPSEAAAEVGPEAVVDGAPAVAEEAPAAEAAVDEAVEAQASEEVMEVEPDPTEPEAVVSADEAPAEAAVETPVEADVEVADESPAVPADDAGEAAAAAEAQVEEGQEDEAKDGPEDGEEETERLTEGS